MTTVPEVRARKGGAPLVMVTAYDAPGAAVADEAGADLLLVGDSVAMVVLGHPDTLHVTVADIAHHTAAVARGASSALIVADMPWLSYHSGAGDAVLAAGRLVRAGASAVKLEGGTKRVAVIEAIVDAEIPVMGHIGLTPQSVLAMGGFKVQGRGAEAAHALLDDAKAVAAAGAFALVLEGLPTEVASLITSSVDIPTIGIGAGVHCDGQVLVWHDVLGFGTSGYGAGPKFVRRYADLRTAAVDGIKAYATDVRNGVFPGEAETYHLPKGVTLS